MATQKIEEGEYGIEVVVSTQPESKPAAAQPVEESKESAKVDAAPTQAPVKKNVAPDADDYDEEEMYGEGTSFAATKEEDDGFQVEEGKQMTETLIVFEKNQFLLYDFKGGKSWQVGDVESNDVSVPEDSCITMIDNEKYRTNLC